MLNFKIAPPLTIICLIEMLVSRLAMYYVRAHVNDALTSGPDLTAFLSNVQIIQCWLELSNSNSNSPPFQPSLKASTTTTRHTWRIKSLLNSI